MLYVWCQDIDCNGVRCRTTKAQEISSLGCLAVPMAVDVLAPDIQHVQVSQVVFAVPGRHAHLTAGMTYEVSNLGPTSRKNDWAPRHKDSTLLLDTTDTTQFLPVSQSIDGNIAVAFTTFAALKHGIYANLMVLSLNVIIIAQRHNHHVCMDSKFEGNNCRGCNSYVAINALRCTQKVCGHTCSVAGLSSVVAD